MQKIAWATRTGFGNTKTFCLRVEVGLAKTKTLFNATLTVLYSSNVLPDSRHSSYTDPWDIPKAWGEHGLSQDKEKLLDQGPRNFHRTENSQQQVEASKDRSSKGGASKGDALKGGASKGGASKHNSCASKGGASKGVASKHNGKSKGAPYAPNTRQKRYRDEHW